MTWPWVSRRAYDEVCRARNLAEERVGTLILDVVRLARRERGLPERRPEEHPKPRHVPIPEGIRNLLAGFSSGATVAMYQAEIQKALNEGQDPERLEAWLKEKLGA